MALNPPNKIQVNATTPTSITLTWNPVPSAEYYVVYRSDNPRGEFTQVGTPTETQFVDNNLVPETTYYYRVATYRTLDGVGAQSNNVTGTTATLGVPNNFTLTPQENGILLNWDATNGDGYVIYRGTEPNQLVELARTQNNTYLDENVTPGTTYYYAVATTRDGNVGTQTGVQQAKAPEQTPTPNPTPAPTNLTGRVYQCNGVILNWVRNPNVNIYNIYRSLDNRNYTLLNTTMNSNYKDTNLTNNTTYYYRVTGLANNRESPQAGPVQVTIPRNCQNNYCGGIYRIQYINGVVYRCFYPTIPHCGCRCCD